MLSEADTEFITGECRWCEETGYVYRDSGFCEDCDNNIIHCGICKEDQHVDDLCRHVFRDANYEWAGSGIGDPYDDTIKIALFTLFDRMPNGFPIDLRTAIGSRKFHTWIVAPMIGGGGSMWLYGMPKRDGRYMERFWGEALVDLGETEAERDDDDRPIDVAYHWLASLYNDQTLDANALTIRWIDEWTARRALKGKTDG